MAFEVSCAFCTLMLPSCARVAVHVRGIPRHSRFISSPLLASQPLFLRRQSPFSPRPHSHSEQTRHYNRSVVVNASASRTVASAKSHADVLAVKNVAGTPAAVEELRRVYDSDSSRASRTPQWQSEITRAAFPYDLDPFQLDALAALAAGESVVLSAPTGAGKTIIGEMTVYLALARGLRVFYTTPLKALSNQKFSDFRRQFGDNRVGLLTGDVTVNRDAEVIVMTTEVYRNMLYGGGYESDNATMVTDNLYAVVFDEFHYLNDRERGTVWEESVINSPEHVLLVALSATMSNTSDVRDWFAAVQGPTALIESHVRPVPLKFQFCNREGVTPLFAPSRESSSRTLKRSSKAGFGRRRSEKGKGKDQADGKPKLHPKLLRSLKEARESAGGARQERPERGRRRGRGRGDSDSDDSLDTMISNYSAVKKQSRSVRKSKYADVPSYPFVVRSLRRRDMLPCIVFIFSRAGCDRAAVAAASERDVLVTPQEEAELRTRLAAFCAAHPDVVQQDRLELVAQGIASHHAGLLPLWKVCIEELFQDGLIKVVFATETLAAGINMPARTTVISTLSKRAGEEGIVQLTTSEVLQMAGRAGRRGKDVLGHSVIMRSPFEGALEAFRVVTSHVDALESKFTPTYGMVLNLLLARSLNDAKKLVNRSFGNFLRNRELKRLSGDRKSVLDSSTGEGESERVTESSVAAREKVALKSVLAEAREIINSADAKLLHSYAKSLERVKAEKRALSYLVQQGVNADAELIENTLAFAPSGTRLLLKEPKKKGESTGAERRRRRRGYSAALAAAGEGDLGAELRAFYLADDNGESDEIMDEDGDDGSGPATFTEAVLLDMHPDAVGVAPVFAAVDVDGKLRLFDHTHVSQLFYDEAILELETVAPNWQESELPSRSEWISLGRGQYSAALSPELEPIVSHVAEWKSKRFAQREADLLAGIPAQKRIDEAQHPEVFAQRQRVAHAKALVREHPLYASPERQLLLDAKRAIPKLEATLGGTADPFGAARRRGGKSQNQKKCSNSKQMIDSESGAGAGGSWDDFMGIVSVLQHYGYIDEEHAVTAIGGLGAKVRAGNELWTSLVLMDPVLEDVSPAHLGAILGSTQNEGGRSDTYVAYEPSETVIKTVGSVAPLRSRLHAVQAEFGADFGVCLDPELMGLVEAWATGVSWVELLSNTSLQEGDACRILRRVLDLLRQVQHLPIVSQALKTNAKRAVALLDRFPVTDDQTYTVRDNEKIYESDADAATTPSSSQSFEASYNRIDN